MIGIFTKRHVIGLIILLSVLGVRHFIDRKIERERAPDEVSYKITQWLGGNNVYRQKNPNVNFRSEGNREATILVVTGSVSSEADLAEVRKFVETEGPRFITEAAWKKQVDEDPDLKGHFPLIVRYDVNVGGNNSQKGK